MTLTVGPWTSNAVGRLVEAAPAVYTTSHPRDRDRKEQAMSEQLTGYHVVAAAGLPHAVPGVKASRVSTGEAPAPTRRGRAPDAWDDEVEVILA